MVQSVSRGLLSPGLRGALASSRHFLVSALALSSAVSYASAASGAPKTPPLFQSPLVTAEQVRASIRDASAEKRAIKFVDASWHLDKTRDARKEFLEEHIKGAVRFDIDAVADKSSDLPHMIPPAQQFSQAMSELGLANSDHIIVYTTRQCFSAARCWWTFQTFGHDKVYVLQGGLPAWKAAGGETEAGDVCVQSSRPPKGLVLDGGNAWLLDKHGFQAALQPDLVKSWTQVLGVVETGKQEGPQVCDARNAARFKAEVDEPRPGVARGRIPGSLNVPFNELLVDGDWTQFKKPEEIRSVFSKAGVDLGSRDVITSCGSGVTAAVLSFAMVLAGKDLRHAPVYDGSWAEWGSRADLPKLT